MHYQHVIILGIDQFAGFCAKKVKEKGCSVCVIDTGENANEMLSATCQRIVVPYYHLNKDDRNSFLQGMQGEMLIISAINPWIISNSLLTKPGVTAVNLHHSLLPKHPGRNAEAWAIYEGDKETGVTWHYISSDVDAGDIIGQMAVALDDKITSLRLLQIQNRLAKESFEKILDDLLNGDAQGTPQIGKHKLHYSWQKPNEGCLDLCWDGVQISRCLRAMDYGELSILGTPYVIFENVQYTWNSYEMTKQDGFCDDRVEKERADIVIYKTEYIIRLKNVMARYGS